MVESALSSLLELSKLCLIAALTLLGLEAELHSVVAVFFLSTYV
jgi:hypothetical protein